MLTHYQIWAAIDALALRADLTPSGLAKQAGLDPTTFNKSKRKTPNGKERWPSTESIAKILEATGHSLEDFVLLITSTSSDGLNYLQPIPFIDSDQMMGSGFFDPGGQPLKAQWDQVRFPEVHDENAYALEVCGEDMRPFYRDGDILIISPNSEIRRRDRILIKLSENELLVGTLERKTAKKITLNDLVNNSKTQTLSMSDVDWVARILWASQ